MKEREISPAHRDRFLATFSQLHGGAPVTVRIDAREEVHDRPLRGICCDGDDVVIQTDHAHRVPHVVDVRLEQTDEGADAGLDIISENRTHTEVRLRWPMQADLLDPAVE